MGKQSSPIFRIRRSLSVVLTLLVLSVLTVLVLTVLLILLVLSVLALVVLIILIGHFNFLLWSSRSVNSGVSAAVIFFAGNLKLFLPGATIINTVY